MKCDQTTFRGRRAIELSNDLLDLVALPGGGHIAKLSLAGLDLNPLWEPPWPTIEPEEYDPLRHPQYGAVEGRLLSSIAGHTLCLNHFGELSEAESAARGYTHGEAPNLPWNVFEHGAAGLAYGVVLPEAGMRFSRKITLRPGETIAYLEEEVTNLRRSDSPLAYQQHVTLGPPFVEAGVTRVDLPGTRARTFPRSFGDMDRLEPDREFAWPSAPTSPPGAAPLEVFPDRRPLCSVCAVLLEPAEREAFAAISNPRLGLLLAYVFPGEAFPWAALWYENGGSAYAPYHGNTVAWGIEFGTCPFPTSRIETLSSGPLFGRRRFGILPAKSTVRTSYQALLQNIPADWRGVEKIYRRDGKVMILERGGRRKLEVRSAGIP